MTGRKLHGFVLAAMLLAAGLALAGCGTAPTSTKPPPGTTTEDDPSDPNRATIFGPGGVGNLFGNRREDEGGAGIGVNTFLWRASLDTISFMPITSADAFGGVIITDWYMFPESPGERFKLNVYILGRALRADGVRVSAFRQTRDGDGSWKDAAVPQETAARIEDAILTRARQLRQETLAQQR